MASLELLLGTAAAVVLLGVLAVRASVRLGLPSLLLYLGIGVVLGESVLGIRFSDAALTEAVGLGALVLILTEGGLTTRWGGAVSARERQSIDVFRSASRGSTMRVSIRVARRAAPTDQEGS